MKCDYCDERATWQLEYKRTPVPSSDERPAEQKVYFCCDIHATPLALLRFSQVSKE